MYTSQLNVIILNGPLPGTGRGLFPNMFFLLVLPLGLPRSCQKAAYVQIKRARSSRVGKTWPAALQANPILPFLVQGVRAVGHKDDRDPENPNFLFQRVDSTTSNTKRFSRSGRVELHSSLGPFFAGAGFPSPLGPWVQSPRKRKHKYKKAS